MGRAKTVVVAGASGFIGSYLTRRFEQDGWTVRTIGRKGNGSSSAGWDDDGGMQRVLDGASLVVNLAGRSVSCRYNDRNKAAILESRVATTQALGRAIARCQEPPSTWLNASTGTIYRDARDRPQSEAGGELGSGFSVDVAKAWEAALEAADTPGTRKIPLRIAIVLGRGGGALQPFANLARLGLGGHMGDGNQKFSWIHVEDLYRSIRFLHARTDVTGPVNVASPDVVSNRDLMRLVRRAYGARFGLPTPSWLLRAGAVLIRTETELVFKSRWVQPQKLLDAGFVYSQPELGRALLQIAKGRA
ncbi:TIGR01777 family oxidoreductase [Pseudarthrobacter phenanthrenivorans]|uniref:NAD-dependent epimerase n=1 Tax=Pseudarthrobacter phenanthrenivorans TaxID=361575 RepID=A0A0B4DSW8_PSEPS|nr:TIGR01777 family oxidoreductase [Pseudarthrobacter phenanthrenivorans]KIC69756.1 NAD-dependent epimerase [Pseudarthrobacter phenanthrenivorans]